MASYDYRCQKCREHFTVERSVHDSSETACTLCGAADVTRIWNAFIRSGGITPDVGQGTTRKSTSASSGGGCGSCSSGACGTCH